ncbi:MAG: hypothetical protein ACHQPI_06910 [Thermoanaerobaculia bacterium]
MGRFTAHERSNATGALSELWLASHFIRQGASVQKPEHLGGRMYDFHVIGSSSPAIVNAPVEVKRLHSRHDEGVSDWDRHRESLFVPNTFAESEFLELAAARLKGSADQLRPLPNAAQDSSPVLAIDITDSRTYQRLLLFDPTDVATLQAQIHSRSRVRRRRSLLLFVEGFDNPALWGFRWLEARKA